MWGCAMIDVGILCVREQPEGLTAIRALLTEDRYRILVSETCPDEVPQLRKALRLWADVQNLALVLTVGGIGVGIRDRMADATAELLERPVPGLAELARLATMQRNRVGALSRGTAGVRGRTLIVNLPAEFTGTALEAILPILPTAVDTIRADNDKLSVA